MKIIATLAAVLTLSACALNQAEASATYIAAEASTAALLQSNPNLLPTVELLTADWTKFEAGKLLPTDEATLLNTIVAATKSKINPTEAAVLDGAVQQLLANQNATAPTPLTGAAGAIVTDVINGVGRAVVVYTTPAASSVGK
jgi:hypothetical protein